MSNKEITAAELSAFERAYDSVPANRIAQNATGHNGVFAAAYSTEVESKLTSVFSVDVKDTGSITNQKQSGRCWMFAGLNVIRAIAMKKLHVKDLELSQSYLMFYDKLEKSNFELEAALDSLDLPDSSRDLEFIYASGGHQDGGYWGFFTALVKKYGVCPKACQPETVPTSASDEMDTVIQTALTRDVVELRAAHREGASIEELRARKDQMLEEIYRILTICIGKPVQEFTFEYEEDNPEKGKDSEGEEKKDDKPQVKRITTTPKEFFDTYVGTDLDNYVCLVNWPVRGFKEYQTYTVRLCQNVVGAPAEVNLNVPIDVMRKAIIDSLKGGDLVWFACDVSAFLLRKGAYLDTKLVDIDTLFSSQFNFDKGERLQARASTCNHAMTFTGVNLDVDGNPDRWKVENSWGDTAGLKGYFTMTDRWFGEYVYEAIVDRKYLDEKTLKALKKKPVVLPPWSPVAAMSK